MRKNKSNSFSSVISSILIFLLAFGVIGFLVVYTDSFTSPLKNFYVTCGNDDFISDRENFNIVLGKEYKFKITTNIDVDGIENKYIVSVVPNETSKTTFSYSVDGTEHFFADLKTLTKGFVISTYDDYFTFTALNDLHDILQLYYPTQTLENVPTTIDSDLPYFRLVVQSGDKTETININFNIKSE